MSAKNTAGGEQFYQSRVSRVSYDVQYSYAATLVLPVQSGNKSAIGCPFDAVQSTTSPSSSPLRKFFKRDLRDTRGASSIKRSRIPAGNKEDTIADDRMAWFITEKIKYRKMKGVQVARNKPLAQSM